MPHRKSAIEELRKSKKRRALNLKRLVTLRKIIKDFKKLVLAKKFEEAKTLIPMVYKAIDKAAKRKVIHKNEAARKKSRLMKFLWKLTTKSKKEV